MKAHNLAVQWISPQEYLDAERLAETKSEYFNGEVFAMAGASFSHVRITLNMTLALGNQLRGKGCQPFGNDLRVLVDSSGLFTYPDLTVACEPLEFFDERQDTLTNPVVVIEILSPATEAYDRGQKWAHYRGVPSLRHYVLVSQHKRSLEHFQRGEDGQWFFEATEENDGEIFLSTIDCRLRVEEIYERVELDDL